MSERLNRIIELARENARVGLDQNGIDDYWENFLDALAEQFPDWTQEELRIGEREFDRKVKGPPELRTWGTFYTI